MKHPGKFLAGVLTVILPCAAGLWWYEHRPQLPPPARETRAAIVRRVETCRIDADQAIHRIQTLPEVRAWAKMIHQLSVGAVRSVTMIEQPPNLANQNWQIGMFESHKTHLVRGQTFYVNCRTGEISVGICTGETISLKQWRTQPRVREIMDAYGPANH